MPNLRIKALMEAQGMSAKTLAQAAGVTPQYIGCVLNGKSSPSAATLGKLAAALGVPTSSLFEDYLTPAQSVAICPHCGGRMNIKTGHKA